MRIPESATIPSKGPGQVTNEVAIQAELLALNAALEGKGAERASVALYALSRDLREARQAVRKEPEGDRPRLYKVD